MTLNFTTYVYIHSGFEEQPGMLCVAQIIEVLFESLALLFPWGCERNGFLKEEQVHGMEFL